MANEQGEREVFRVEAREGHYIRLIVRGAQDDHMLDGLEEFIAWKRRTLQAAPTLTAPD
jgi:hypothetical protein